MTLDELNRQDRDGFVAAVGWVFEHSPWVAERAWMRRPFPSVDALYQAMSSQVAAASPEEQLALLRAHPDLGAVRPEMSQASALEQSGAGLDALTHDESERLRALNAAYRDKFGFPFVYAVRSSTKRDILNQLEKRIISTRDTELGEALRQVYRIARFRLEDTVR